MTLWVGSIICWVRIRSVTWRIGWVVTWRIRDIIRRIASRGSTRIGYV